MFSKGNRPSDALTTALTITDTNNSRTLWPHGEVTKAQMRIIAGDKSSDVLADLEPKPDEYYVLKHRWNALFQTYLGLALRTRASVQLIFRGFHRFRRHRDFVFWPRFGL